MIPSVIVKEPPYTYTPPPEEDVELLVIVPPVMVNVPPYTHTPPPQ